MCTKLRKFPLAESIYFAARRRKRSGNVRLPCNQRLQQPSVAKDKPAGSGLPKPIRLFFSLLPAGLIPLARRFERLAARAKNFARCLKLVHMERSIERRYKP
jgi:hypothetical protein